MPRSTGISEIFVKRNWRAIKIGGEVARPEVPRSEWGSSRDEKLAL